MTTDPAGSPAAERPSPGGETEVPTPQTEATRGPVADFAAIAFILGLLVLAILLMLTMVRH